MRETLYLRLRGNTPEAAVTYALAAGAPGPATRAVSATLEQALALAAGRRLVVFVPGMDVRLTSVTVAARQAQKVLQAAPYALEDQLAEDVDTLHFALGPRQANGSHPVAVVARTRMDEWLQLFRESGLRPDALVPETLCLPWDDNHRWGMLAEDNLSTVRTGPFGGFACAPEDLESYLQLSDPDGRFGLRIVLPRDFAADFTRLNRQSELLPAQGDVFETLLQQWAPERSINLLQGAYSQREDLNKLWLPWRAAAATAAVWVLFALVGEGLAAMRLGQELRAQEQRNVQRFQSLFPAETKIVDLAAQAERQYAALKGGAQAGGPLPLLEGAARALTANPGLTLQSAQFRDGALFLSLTGSDLQALESLRGWFAGRHDLALEVQSANAGSEGVQIRLKLSRA